MFGSGTRALHGGFPSVRGVYMIAQETCPTLPASLDRVQNNCNTRFPDWQFLNVRTGESLPFRCKCWRCELCGPKKAIRFKIQMARWAEAKGLCRLMTLTLDPAKIPVGDDRYAYIADVWRKFREYLKREYGKVSFVWIVELQRNGNPHFHVLVSRYVSQKWVSATWDTLGGGRIVDVRYVDIQRVRVYLSKYLAKQWNEQDIPKGKRRYTTSRDISIWSEPDGTTREPTGEWMLFVGTPDDLARFVSLMRVGNDP